MVVVVGAVFVVVVVEVMEVVSVGWCTEKTGRPS